MFDFLKFLQARSFRLGVYQGSVEDFELNKTWLNLWSVTRESILYKYRVAIMESNHSVESLKDYLEKANLLDKYRDEVVVQQARFLCDMMYWVKENKKGRLKAKGVVSVSGSVNVFDLSARSATLRNALNFARRAIPPSVVRDVGLIKSSPIVRLVVESDSECTCRNKECPITHEDLDLEFKDLEMAPVPVKFRPGVLAGGASDHNCYGEKSLSRKIN